VHTRPHAYAHIALNAVDAPAPVPDLDALQVRTLCAAMLRRFLGVTGAAVPVDVLLVQGAEAWVRVPREDLGAFAAAVAAWPASCIEGGGAARCVVRLRGAADFLGALVAREAQMTIWTRG